MKIVFRLWWMGLLIPFLFSCEDKEEDADVINLSSEVLTFGAEKSQQTLLVSSTANWTVGTEADWVFTEISADKVSVSVDANDTYAARSAVIVLKGGNCIREVDILQAAKPASLELTANSGVVYDLNDMYAVGVKATQKWTATVDGNWIQLDKNSGEGNAVVTMKFSPNRAASPRIANITFTGEDKVTRTFTLTQGEVLPSDREHDSLALVSIYHAMQGEQWVDQGTNKWLSDKPIDEWWGVTVEDGRVAHLFLNQKKGNENAYIHPDIKYLTAVKTFSVAYSQIGGTIPNEIGRCVNLQTFSCSNYDLSLQGHMTGTLPVIFCSLPEFIHLDVRRNKMSGELPWEYAAGRRLVSLDFEMNAFTGTLPVLWSTSPILSQLNMSSNQLTGEIPEEYGNMRNISTLFVDNNKEMSGKVPESLCYKKASGALEINIQGTNILPCE